MKRIAILLAGFAAIPAHAGPETDFPHREWGMVAMLNMSLTDATACVTRELARQYGRTTPVPAEGGTDIDGGPGGGLFGLAYDPWVRIKVREANGVVTLGASYRHPVSAKQLGKVITRMQKRCLRVAEIRPAGNITNE